MKNDIIWAVLFFFFNVIWTLCFIWKYVASPIFTLQYYNIILLLNIFTSWQITIQKMKFSIKDFSSKCNQIRRKLRIWSYLLKKSLMENFIFCVVFCKIQYYIVNNFALKSSFKTNIVCYIIHKEMFLRSTSLTNSFWNLMFMSRSIHNSQFHRTIYEFNSYFNTFFLKFYNFLKHVEVCLKLCILLSLKNVYVKNCLRFNFKKNGCYY